MQCSLKPRRPASLLAFVLSLGTGWVGCSQLVDFDRSMIDSAARPIPGLDSGAKDAGLGDANMPDASKDGGPSPRCDVATHKGCAADQLCCEVGGELDCVATSRAQCTACGVACDGEKADVCTDLTCGCGAGSSTACSGVKPFCSAGSCFECDTADDQGCEGTKPICNAGTCEGCTQAPNNCGAGLTCLPNGACRCATSTDCANPSTPICDSATFLCRGCDNNSECNSAAAPADLCNEGSGTCVACLASKDCDKNTDYCSAFKCVAKKALGVACAGAGECTSGRCADGVCCDSECDGICEACRATKTGGATGTCSSVTTNTDPDEECPGAAMCHAAGACEKANGASCGSDAECDSDFCVDGLCCDAECDGTCQACSQAKKGSGPNGTCGFIDMPRNPDSECASAGCDGQGACLP